MSWGLLMKINRIVTVEINEHLKLVYDNNENYFMLDKPATGMAGLMGQSERFILSVPELQQIVNAVQMLMETERR